MARSQRITLSIIAFITTFIAVSVLWFITYTNMQPVPLSLSLQTRGIPAFSGMNMETGIGNDKKTVLYCLPLLLDRNGVPLNTTYSTKWNQSDNVHLHKIPELMKKIFILSEDSRFYEHKGIDWRARIHAAVQNIRAGKAVRGASTITEQVIRMIHPRKRTIWSRWLEGFEAIELEKINTKADILEFYLNQIPYASNRRGVVQAARFYFDRTLDTLSTKEIFALATMVRAPSAYDLYNYPGRIDHSMNILAKRAISKGVVTASQWEKTRDIPFDLKCSELCVESPHFVKHVYKKLHQPELFAGSFQSRIRTTLDGTLQKKVHNILATTLKNQKSYKAINGAILIAEHGTGEILAWTVVSTDSNLKTGESTTQADISINQAVQLSLNKLSTLSGTQCIDAVKALRQPGSAMKPFLYALALEKGWNAATLIYDAPLKEPVGLGIHTYHNYSNIHYGPVTLRNALGNSLNIPAVKTVRFTGVASYLQKLKKLGITTLNRHPDFYGDGLALGNGEVSLYDMVQAYSVLANAGKFIKLTCFYDAEQKHYEQHKSEISDLCCSTPDFLNSKTVSPNHFFLKPDQVFSKEVTSIIGNILSDPGARELEFGGSDLLNFPIQTAVKTGTSSDYRDAWAMGYNRHYTAGVWMGNLDGSPTAELTGSRAPAFVLRSIFAELNHIRQQHRETDTYADSDTTINRPLYMSPALVQEDVCIPNYKSKCLKKTEWFVSHNEKATVPEKVNEEQHINKTGTALSVVKQSSRRKFGFINPLNGLQVAMDPRIPDELEYMEFKVAGLLPGERVRWIVNNDSSASEYSVLCDTLKWKVQRGYHRVDAKLIDNASVVIAMDSVSFFVK